MLGADLAAGADLGHAGGMAGLWWAMIFVIVIIVLINGLRRGK